LWLSCLGRPPPPPRSTLFPYTTLFRSGMIARQFRLLLAGLAWQGQRPEVLARTLALKSTYPAKKALAQARGWTLEQAASALEACAQCDAQLKRGADGRLALELLTVKLAAIRRAPA